MIKPELSIRYQWAKLTETYLYPDKWRGDVSRTSSWRGLLSISGELQTLKKLEVGGMNAQIHDHLNLIHWNRANQVDVQYKNTEYQVLLPRVSEPDSDFLLVRLHDGISEYHIECLAEDKPNDKFIIDALDSQIDWVNNSPELSFISSGECSVKWVVQNCGKWGIKNLIQSTAGKQSVKLDIPFGEVVYLELCLNVKENPIIHRYYVIGKPGVASGRKVWFRGAMFESKMQKQTPWTSVIVPVFHPNDIDKIPAYVQWNQIDWWIFKNSTLSDSIEAIKQKNSLSKITIVGDFNDDSCDIQLLKPFQVNLKALSVNKTYAICLFDDAGEPEYARRAGWSMFKTGNSEFINYNFIDRVWFQGLISQSNTDGHKQYGYGFSFARPPENENLWTLSLKDIEWREHRELFPCHNCAYKSACHQALPMPYSPDDIRRVPWIAADRKICPLLELLTNT